MHLDIKRPGLDAAIADLLTRMDMWDHVAYCNTDNGGVILRDPRLKLRRYKAGLYLDRSEVFSDAIQRALALPGDGLIVDDPRGVASALGRPFRKLSRDPVTPSIWTDSLGSTRRSESELTATLRDAADWNIVAHSPEGMAGSAKRIVTRAKAADALLEQRTSSRTAFQELEERVRNRSLHKEWMYHGLDGAAALRTLILLRAPGAADLARFALWRDDPALDSVKDPRWNNPPAWTDFRVKMVVFSALERLPGKETEKLCRDYLALSDEDARKLGPPLFEQAGRALLAVNPTKKTALLLMKHRLQVVRGRAILDCLANAPKSWARAALEAAAPHALNWRMAH
jgi:hypothetical protein